MKANYKENISALQNIKNNAKLETNQYISISLICK